MTRSARCQSHWMKLMSCTRPVFVLITMTHDRNPSIFRLVDCTYWRTTKLDFNFFVYCYLSGHHGVPSHIPWQKVIENRPSTSRGCELKCNLWLHQRFRLLFEDYLWVWEGWKINIYMSSSNVGYVVLRYLPWFPFRRLSGALMEMSWCKHCWVTAFWNGITACQNIFVWYHYVGFGPRVQLVRLAWSRFTWYALSVLYHICLFLPSWG